MKDGSFGVGNSVSLSFESSVIVAQQSKAKLLSSSSCSSCPRATFYTSLLIFFSHRGNGQKNVLLFYSLAGRHFFSSYFSFFA